MATTDTREFREQATALRTDPWQAPLAGEEAAWTRGRIGGSTGEAIAGVATAVLAIVGLSHVAPFYLAAVATIVLAAGLVLRGMRIAGRCAPRMEGGMPAEFVGGVAGVVLGILSLLGIYPTLLLPVMAIVFGAVWLLSVAASLRQSGWLREHQTRGPSGDMLSGVFGGRLLVGVAALVLGIIGTVGVSPLALVLVALLVLGASTVLGGAAFRSWLAMPVRR